MTNDLFTTSKRCRNPACQNDLFVADESRDEPGFCTDCGNKIPAFQPQPPDGDFFKVPDRRCQPVEFSADQCDGCGGSEYTLVLVKNRWVVKCSPDNTYDDPTRAGEENFDAEGRFQGCGTEYRLTLMPGRLVVWP